MVVRAGLRPGSSLHPRVSKGIGALERAHREKIAADVRDTFADSVEIDEGLRPGHEQEHRWDYLLGHGPSRQIVGMECHTAGTSEISVVIEKLRRAKEQLRPHLRDGVRVTRWYWVASGRVDFVPSVEKASLRLAQAGVSFVGRSLRAKDLPR